MHGKFNALLRELSVTRSRYETLRAQGHDNAATADTLTELHALRANIAHVRGLL